jgi:hypothetical protein
MTIFDHPWQILLLSMLAFSLATWLGASMRRSATHLLAEDREDFGVVLAAALTLLGLIIGFTFSMAISRYDQRKNYEEAEANAIGTEYARTDFLPDAAVAATRQHLKEYTELRLRFYAASEHEQLNRVNAETSRLQKLLWSDVSGVGKVQSSPIIVLTVTGMNDVLNSQGYTQAAWWNRIPIAAWGLMATIAVVCNMMIGYNGRNVSGLRSLRVLLPFILSVSLFLIADIDSPGGGVIRVIPQNLKSLMDTLR